MYIFLGENLNKISKIKTVLILLITLCFVFLGYQIWINYLGLRNAELENEYKLPVTHYIMMGLNDEGYLEHRYSGNSSSDVHLTHSKDTYDERVELNIMVIKERLENYGFFGFINHLRIKLCNYTWNDGTYGAFWRVNCASRIGAGHIMTRIFTSDGDLNKYLIYYCQTFHFLILASILILGVNIIRNKEKGELSLFFIITIIGIILFYAIWESCSRYLLQFYPILLLSAIFGLYSTTYNDSHKL